MPVMAVAEADGFECLPMSDPASDIIIDLLNSIKLEKKLRLENREGNQSVSTISGFYDTTVHKATGIESFVKERMLGSSLKYAFQRFIESRFIRRRSLVGRR